MHNYKYTNNNLKTSKGVETQMVKDTLTFQIDKELKTELKVIALKQDKKLKDILSELIQDFVNENK